MAEKTNAKKIKKEDFKTFVMKAGWTLDPLPTEDDPQEDGGAGDLESHQMSDADKLKQKVIAGLYRICSRGRWQPKSIKKYLELKGYTITPEELQRLKAVRIATKTLFCGEEKY